jgi:hypothetical protein
MRGWDDTQLNAAMAQPGRVWQEFDRLVQPLRPLLGDDLAVLRNDIQRLREERNHLVHSVWMRTADVPVGLYRFVDARSRSCPAHPVTADGLMDLARRIGHTARKVQELTTALLYRFKELQEPYNTEPETE